jgi:formylglycine-generating enzyme required for sulfatase activity
MMDQVNSEEKSAVKVVVAVVLVLALAGGLALLGYQRLAKRHAAMQPQKGLQTVTNSIGMQLVKLPGGHFVMGDDTPGSAPKHDVQVYPFYIATHEVTQAQWQAVMGNNPSYYKDPRRPVDNVTWLDTQTFLEQLNRMEGTNKYRLPSEAEWEYAARAGSKGHYFFGDDAGQLQRYAWFGADPRNGTEPVGRRLPNAWGLYDVYGNVWEWVEDCWHGDYRGAPANSRVWGGGDCSQRVLRGGGWANKGDYLGSTVRGTYGADYMDTSNGFRVVLSP